MHTLTLLHVVVARLRQILIDGHRDERGEVTEKVIIVAVFAGLAIAAGAIIVAKVMARAEGIALE